MCWVMPPASPATTFVLRMWSSSEVLPWSTCPITVTTGGRGRSVSARSAGCSGAAIAYSSSFTAWNPNADAISSIRSKSSRWLIVTICPSSLKAKVTICVGGTLSTLASSLTVMNSVTRTSVFSRSFSAARLLDVAEARPLVARPRAPAGHRALDGRESPRDVLRHRFLVHRGLAALLALLPGLVATPLFERAGSGRGGRDGTRRNRAPRHAARDRLGTDRRGNELPRRPRHRGRQRRRRRGRHRRRGAGRCRRRGRQGRRRRLDRRLGRGDIAEQRGRPLLERDCGLLLFLDAGRLERRAGPQLLLGRHPVRLHLGLGFRRRHLGRGPAAPLGACLFDDRCRLGRLDRPTALARGRRRLLLAPLLTLPARAHHRHLLVLERGEMTAHEDVHLLEHGHHLLTGDPELRRQIMNPCRHSLLRKPHQTARERALFGPHRLHRGAAKPRAQLQCIRSSQHGNPACHGQPFHFLPRPGTGVRRQHHHREPSLLQPRPHPRHADHDLPAAEPETEQPREPIVAIAHAGAGALFAPAPGSSPPSSVSSFRNAIRRSASSGVIPCSLSTSSRSRSITSCSVFLPFCSSSAISSGGKPCSSASGTFTACSSSGGSGANSGPSPPRSSHSRLE